MTGLKWKTNLVTVNLSNMTKPRRQFTREEKHSILQEAERQGVSETARRYNIAHSVLSYCKKKYLSNGKEGLKANYKKVDPEDRALEDENARLNTIIANQVLELEFKTELLKKSDGHYKKVGR